jgi:hypothetical protein
LRIVRRLIEECDQSVTFILKFTFSQKKYVLRGKCTQGSVERFTIKSTSQDTRLSIIRV